MVGLTHFAMREVVRQYLPAGACTLWPTEMLNSRRIPSENLGKTLETLKGENETCLVPQLLGNEFEPIRKSILKLKEWGAEGIDINMGCSVRRALQHNYGVSLMGDPDYAAAVVRMAVDSSDLPVSVKLRSGLQSDLEYLLNFVEGLQNAGASWITLHPRTSEQARRGQADWNQIRELKARLHIPVIGNGDIQTAQDVLRMLEQTKCDRVMIGRALTARPWIFWQVGEALGWPPPPASQSRQMDSGTLPKAWASATTRAPQTPVEEGAEYGKCLKQLAALLKLHWPMELGLRRFSFFVKTGSVWLTFGHRLYAGVTRSKTWAELEEFLHAFFQHELEMSQRTELRQ